MTTPVPDRGRIREAGDSALLLELAARIDPAVNSQAIAIASAMRAARVPGVHDVLSAFRSVAVYFDPLTTEPGVVVDALERAARAPGVPRAGRLVEVPVRYGGANGPDLGDVAVWAGLTPDAVIGRHAERVYRVYMLGFMPGFAYLGTVDDAIAMPRRASPRVRVTAGSVGIAGRQTGVYPLESPGGWRVIGRTAARFFDPARSPSTLVSPGDDVRFVRDGEGPQLPSWTFPGTAAVEHVPGPCVVVLQPGLLTTIQDSGRRGYQHLGVPVAGPLDEVSHRIANRLVGNDESAAALEATILGPALRVERDAVVAVAGADLSATVDGAALPPGTARACRSGSEVRFGDRRTGARAYLAIDGGFAATPVFGSQATHIRSGLGGLSGGPLRAGDRIPLGQAREASSRRAAPVPPVTSGGTRLRVMPGPASEAIDRKALEALVGTRFTVSPQSDRMGYRLSGSAVTRSDAGDAISGPTFTGAIQVPPSGEPILLMADRQTAGGYPQVATVISADIPMAGQLGPGDWVEFEVCSRVEAMAALRARMGTVRAIG